jgi:signal peptidase II
MPDSIPNRSNARLFWTTVITVIVLDFVTKMIVQHTLHFLEPQPIIGDVVRFTLVYNSGAAFSMSLGRQSRWIFGAFAVVALYILWKLYRQSAPGDRARVLALALASGGATGNLIDRIREPRGVVDFIDIGVGAVRFWTFNVADSAVTIGALLLAWVLWHEERSGTPAKKTEAPASQVEERTGT